jgi:hypothetical protein
MNYQLTKIKGNLEIILNIINLKYVTKENKEIIKVNLGRALIHLSVINNINNFYNKEEIKQLLLKKEESPRKKDLKEKVNFIIEDLNSHNYNITKYEAVNIFDTLIEIIQYYDLDIKDCYNIQQ